MFVIDLVVVVSCETSSWSTRPSAVYFDVYSVDVLMSKSYRPKTCINVPRCW